VETIEKLRVVNGVHQFEFQCSSQIVGALSIISETGSISHILKKNKLIEISDPYYLIISYNVNKICKP